MRFMNGLNIKLNVGLIYSCYQNIFYKSLNGTHLRRLSWCYRRMFQVPFFLPKAILHLFPLPDYIDPGLLLMFQNISQREKTNLLTAAFTDQHLDNFSDVGFLHPNECCQCRSIPLHSGILFVLYSVFWLRDDSH